ncbi:MAG: hypothetical protein WCC17_07575 [Candidatus Nitrosopolaris sp.]
MSENNSEEILVIWRKKIEMIGIDIKGLDQEAEIERFTLKTKLMNAHFISELDKIGLQLINIRGTLLGRLVLLLEAKNLNTMSS